RAGHRDRVLPRGVRRRRGDPAGPAGRVLPAVRGPARRGCRVRRGAGEGRRAPRRAGHGWRTPATGGRRTRARGTVGGDHRGGPRRPVRAGGGMTTEAVTEVVVTPIAFPDPPLLNAAGIHQPWALRPAVGLRGGP